MKKNIFFTTSNSNNYLFNLEKMQFFYFTPILKILYDYYKEYGLVSLKILDNKKYNKHLKNKLKSKIELEQNLRKFKLLLKNKVIDNGKFKTDINWDNITPELMKYQIVNTKIILFEVTERCNLDCYYCGYGNLYKQNSFRKKSNLSFYKARRLIDVVLNYWENEISASSRQDIIIGFYGGEPLLNMTLVKEIVSYLSKNKSNTLTFNYRITTNAVLLNKHIDYLYDKDFNIIISLDGDKKADVFRKFQNKSESFEVVLKNIDILYQKYPKYFSEKVNFNSVLTNESSFLEVLEFFNKRYNKSPNISSLAGSNIDKKKLHDFKRIYLNKDKSYLEAIKLNPSNEYLIKTLFVPRLESFLKSYLSLRVFNINELLYRENRPFTSVRGCLPFSLKIFLTTKGELLPCEKVDSQYSFGNVDKTPIFDFNFIKKKYKSYLERITEQCQTCYLQSKCGFCLFLAEENKGTIYCPEYMDKKRMESYFNNQFTKLENSILIANEN